MSLISITFYVKFKKPEGTRISLEKLTETYPVFDISVIKGYISIFIILVSVIIFVRKMFLILLASVEFRLTMV